MENYATLNIENYRMELQYFTQAESVYLKVKVVLLKIGENY